jgi:hypothetical protein
MLHPLSTRVASALLAGGLAWASAVPAQTQAVGWVSAVRDGTKRPTSLVITDAGTSDYSLEVRVGDAVPRGRSLRVTPSDAAVEVILSDGQRIVVRDQAVPIAAAQAGLGDTRVVRSLAEFFGWFGERGTRRAYAYSRGDDDAVEVLPGLTSGASHLVTGTRTLYLAWLGGQPPFSVTLRNVTTGNTLFMQADVVRREVSAQVELALGEHRLEVAAGDTTAIFDFDVRDAADLPQLGIAADNDLGEIGTTIWAHELLTTDAAWSFEAFEKLYEQARGRYRPAIDLIRDLQAGAFRADEH